ncbi:MAG: MBL fold metallo-hydrolase [Bacteroidetes bacterium]|nr:MBL fold metallo-hydrolase [Bacteroidota bacterium]
MVKILDLQFQGQSGTIAAFLVETGDGSVLIETGPHSSFPALSAALKKHDYRPEQVKHVFLTHIHLDHAGAAWVFAKHGATIYVHPLGKPHLQNPEKLLTSARRIYQGEMHRLWGDLKPISAERIRAMGHKEKVKIGKVGFKAWHTPGHAVHHIAWQVGNELFTGDVGGIRIGENGPVVPPCPPPDINVEDWIASIDLMISKRFSALYLTHFGKVTEVRKHLIELRGRLRNWATWMKPYWENGTDPKEITPIFQSYVARQLNAAGVSGADLARYEMANPAWMSVAGLLRYWSKKGEGG